MKKRVLLIAGLAACLAGAPALAATTHFWQISSPDHGQTFAYGSEKQRVWKIWNGHLVLLLSYTNDPFVDRQNPRETDDFRFDFPTVRAGADGRTVYFRSPTGRLVPVARKQSSFLGIDEVKLLPNVEAVVSKPHGYVTVMLNVVDLDGLAER